MFPRDGGEIGAREQASRNLWVKSSRRAQRVLRRYRQFGKEENFGNDGILCTIL